MTTPRLNQARLADLHTTMTGHVERGDISGIVTLIGRGDEIQRNQRGQHELFIGKTIYAAPFYC